MDDILFDPRFTSLSANRSKGCDNMSLIRIFTVTYFIVAVSNRDNRNGVKGARAGGSMETGDGAINEKNKPLEKRSKKIDRSDSIGVNDVDGTEGGDGFEKIAPVAGASTHRIDEDLCEEIKHLGNESEDIHSNPSNEAAMEGVRATIETASTGGVEAEEITPGDSCRVRWTKLLRCDDRSLQDRCSELVNYLTITREDLTSRRSQPLAKTSQPLLSTLSVNVGSMITNPSPSN